MEEFYYAGGLPAVLRQLGEAGQLRKEALTVNGKTIWENNSHAPNWNEDVIRPMDNPIAEKGSIAVLKGSLAPSGAVIKPSAATPELMKHRGRAVVFEDIEDYYSRIDDPDLDIDESCVMVLKIADLRDIRACRKWATWACLQTLEERYYRYDPNLRCPHERHGLRHRRFTHYSRGCRGGTAGTCSKWGYYRARCGQSSLESGSARRRVGAAQSRLKPTPPAMESGYQKLYYDHVMQADTGADFDFLLGCRGAEVPRDSH